MIVKNILALRKFSMFLQGIIVLQPLYLGINTPYYTIKRFKIPESSVDLYITKINITMQLGYFVGLLLANFYFYVFPRWIQRYNLYISVVTNWLTVTYSTLLLLSYLVKGDEGSLTFYFYMLVMCALVFGINESFAMNVGIVELPWFTASIPASGLMVVAIEFTIISCQITILIFLCAFTSVLWMVSYMQISHDAYQIDEASYQEMELEAQKYYYPADYSFLKRMWMSRYPFVASAVGLGYLYGFYPAIIPYKLANLRDAYYIDLVSIFAGSSVALMVSMLCEYTRFGPNKNWEATDSKWVYSLFVAIPYLLLPVFFINPLHFPETPVFKVILENRGVVALLAVSFNMMSCLLTVVGYSASSKQTNRENDPDMAPLNVFITYTVMLCVILYSQGYLTFYGMVESGKLTVVEGGKGKRFFYWLGKSFVYGWNRFRLILVSDIRADILKIKEL
ncbi:conserved hypothetical protein [Theileria orientalis strain Shintoku]|uniref:Uncharacterized protein n=1 Tax=Theileria orientalis strain Shintoku TaxID=869250 RepID=J4D8T0_THEOR|nr:conserved hypothetical protein [Theileria orientalis strain Shintoku]BAM40985.1 conserved hypothetical protein [Theileria orientalis strain Shintoku]|eukprot:XP_009691286.1 conserved hypothetical protein [Theileria orientalis strain Shintoku]